MPVTHRIPNFGELEGRPTFGDLRMGWNADGLAISLSVFGKSHPPWCKLSRLEESDGLILWINTRPGGDVHRATRFCHQLMFLPGGSGKKSDAPSAVWMEIDRAREHAPGVDPKRLRVRSEHRIDGYLMRATIPSEALNGYDRDVPRHLGFTYALMDRELGWQSFTVGNEFNFASDLSLWGQLDLVS